MRHLLCCLSIIAATALVYGRALSFGYVGIDDVDYVVRSPAVQQGLRTEGVAWAFSTFRMSNWHPLTWLSYMLDVSLFGEDPGAKHAVNVLLHACNSLLVYGLVYRLLPARRKPVALLAGVSFAVHPLHVESVAWIAERKDVLCALFYLAAVHLHLGFLTNPSRARYLMVQVACLLALLSKPMAVTLPIALLLLDYWPGRRIYPDDVPGLRNRLRMLSRLVMEKLPVILMSGVVCALTIVAQGDAVVRAVDVSVGYRLQNAAIAYATYLLKMLFPVGLAPLYPLRPIDFVSQFLPALSVVLVVIAVVLRRRRVAPWWVTGVLWFLLTLLPVIGLVQTGVQSHADRYTYIPSVGLTLAVAMTLSTVALKAWRPLLLASSAAVLFHLSLAWIQVGYWANGYMAYSRILAITPDSLEAHVGLVAVYSEAGDLARATEHVEAAFAIDGRNPYVFISLGNIQVARRDLAAAEASFRRALELKPGLPLALNNLAVVLERTGQHQEALRRYCELLAIDATLDGIAESIRRLRAEALGSCDG